MSAKRALDKLKRTKWFRERPLIVQKAHDIWCPGDEFIVDDEVCWLVGFTETDDSEKSGDPYDLMLILTKIDPSEDFEEAIAASFRMCAKHFNKVVVH